MPDYRRLYVPGGTVFCTLVTYRRRPLFNEPQACKLLGEAMRDVRTQLPFQALSVVLMPDHMHAILTLPQGDGDYSTRWKRVKRELTLNWLAHGGSECHVTASQSRRGNRGVWQRRFYEHQVRDEDELAALCDYVHFNPVKHGHAKAPWDWPYSSFRRFVEAGHYTKDWGQSEPSSIQGIDLE